MRVAIFLYDGFTATDAMGSYRVFLRAPGFEPYFVATEPGTLTADNGVVRVRVEHAIDDREPPDLVLVPGSMASFLAVMRDAVVLDWLRTLRARGTIMTSVCSGALILGAAGLLQGRKACTHWGVRLLLTRTGATATHARFVGGDGVYSAAGVSAGVDLALHLVAELSGPSVAVQTAHEAGVAPDRWLGFGTPSLAGPLTTLRGLAWMLAQPAYARLWRERGLRFWASWLVALARGFHRGEAVVR